MLQSVTPPVRYAIRTTVFEDGERMPILVDAANGGMPLFDPCVFVCTELRPRIASAATIDQALRGVRLLLTFAADRHIDLQERFALARFLDLHELDGLVRRAYLPAGSTDLPRGDLPPTDRRGTSLDKMRRRAPKTSHRTALGLGTVSIRLYYASTYLEWMGHQAARKACKTLEQKDRYVQMLREFLDLLRARTPAARGKSDRQGLAQQQKTELLRVINPECRENPWPSEFVRDRNRLIVFWGLGTGLRRGELLGLRIKVINFRRLTADVVRRPDDREDPRKYQPNTKTRERSIGISEELAYWTHHHIVTHRSKLREARKHDFLFVAEKTGRPLSLAALSKVFRSLREKHPSVGEELTSHVLRHTWNEDFSEVADRAGLSEEDERRARNHAMGWSDYSKSSDHYLRRRTARMATEASVRIQQSVVDPVLRGDKHE